MNKSHIFLICLINIVVSSVASAAWVPLTGDPIPLNSLPYGTLTVGDKEFFGFELLSSATGGAIAPDLNSFFVQGGQNDSTGDYGLRFLLAINVGSGQSVDSTLSFAVAAIPRFLSPILIINQNYLIKDVSMVLTGVSATDTGVVNITETVLDEPIIGQMLAELICSKQEGSDILTDYAEFDPVPEIWVQKQISVVGGTGLTGAAHLSEFFQFFSQTPEPSTIILLGLGTLALLPKRRKQKSKKREF